MSPYPSGRLACPATEARLLDHDLLLRLHLLPLCRADSTIPLSARIPDHLVLNPGLVAPLVPRVVAPVAEHHLVGRRAMHARASLAERLLRRARRRRTEAAAPLGVVLGGGIVRVGLEDVAPGLGGRHGGCCCRRRCRRGRGPEDALPDALAVIGGLCGRGRATTAGLVVLASLALLLLARHREGGARRRCGGARPGRRRGQRQRERGRRGRRGGVARRGGRRDGH